MNRKRWSVLIVIGVMAIGSLFLLRHRNEPQYQGKPLSYWIDRVREELIQSHKTHTRVNSRIAEDFKDAVRSTGSNAVPYLMKELGRTPSILQKLTPSFFVERGWIDKNYDFVDRNIAAVGFFALGTNGLSALPELGVLLKDPEDAAHVASILPSLGESTYPVLTNALTNGDVRVRYAVVLATSHYKDSNRIAAVAVRCLNDPDADVRHEVIRRLLYKGFSRDEIVSKLITALNDTDSTVQLEAIWHLEKFEPIAIAAIHALEKLTTNAAPQIRAEAESAINQIKNGHRAE
jgi:hypothetical protein